MKVLIIDDDPIFLMLHKRIVVNTGLCNEPVAFSQPEKVLGYLKNNVAKNAAEKFLLLLDINMPLLNGWELLALLNIHKLTDNVSVALVSSSTSVYDKEQANQLSNVQFFEKPLKAEVITVWLKAEMH